MLLMNGDRPVLQFSLDNYYIRVIDNDFLPYALRDYICDTSFDTPEASKEAARRIIVLKDYLCTRTLTLSRENAKAILHTLALPQRLHTDDLVKIVMSCNGLSMTDNYWIREESSNVFFSEVNLRNHHLADAAYEISILGRDVSATKEIMQPDIATDGMFAKTWVRGENSIKLWKTSKASDYINAVVEKEASDILDASNVNHVKYDLFERDGMKITSCDCIANDDTALVNAYELSDWCNHTGRDLLSFVETNYLEDFSKMCVIDYVLGNTDRHKGNINFLMDNKTGSIMGMAPLFDHNQALICDKTGKGLDDDLIYDITGLSMYETALKYYNTSNICFDESKLPENVLNRLNKLTDSISQDVDTVHTVRHR